MDATLLNQITSNPLILTGKPVYKGPRISVDQVLKMLSRGISHIEKVEEYPLLEEDDNRACVLKNNFSIIKSEIKNTIYDRNI